LVPFLNAGGDLMRFAQWLMLLALACFYETPGWKRHIMAEEVLPDSEAAG